MASLGPGDALLHLPVRYASLHLTSLYLRNWNIAALHLPRRLNLTSDRVSYFRPVGGEKSHGNWPEILYGGGVFRHRILVVSVGEEEHCWA